MRQAQVQNKKRGDVNGDVGTGRCSMGTGRCSIPSLFSRPLFLPDGHRNCRSPHTQTPSDIGQGESHFSAQAMGDLGPHLRHSPPPSTPQKLRFLHACFLTHLSDDDGSGSLSRLIPDLPGYLFLCLLHHGLDEIAATQDPGIVRYFSLFSFER